MESRKDTVTLQRKFNVYGIIRKGHCCLSHCEGGPSPSGVYTLSISFGSSIGILRLPQRIRISIPVWPNGGLITLRNAEQPSSSTGRASSQRRNASGLSPVSKSLLPSLTCRSACFSSGLSGNMLINNVVKDPYISRRMRSSCAASCPCMASEGMASEVLSGSSQIINALNPAPNIAVIAALPMKRTNELLIVVFQSGEDIITIRFLEGRGTFRR